MKVVEVGLSNVSQSLYSWKKKGNKNITNLIKVQRMFLATRHGQEAGPK